MVKYFLCPFKIFKGPLYGGCNECVLARSCTKICVQVSNSFETYVGFLHRARGLYPMFAILAVRRSTKEVTSRGLCGDLQKELS